MDCIPTNPNQLVPMVLGMALAYGGTWFLAWFSATDSGIPNGWAHAIGVTMGGVLTAGLFATINYQLVGPTVVSWITA